jgi:FkbM family methyltransferase
MGADGIKSVIRAVVPRPVRNWLRSPSKSTQWLWDATRYSLGSTETFQFPPNLTLVCHPRAYRVAYDSQVADPEQKEEFHNFLQWCNPGMFLLDIGAHFGIFSLAAAKFGGRAIAIDPSPIATRMIAKQSALNKLTERVRIIQAAVRDAAGAVQMVSSGVFSDGYFKLSAGREQSELTRTQATTIDELVGQFGAPTHIKMDVEGQEAAVIRGGRATFENHSPALFLELHTEMIVSEGGNPMAALEELDKIGYEAFALDGRPLERDAILQKPLIRIVAMRGTRN